MAETRLPDVVPAKDLASGKEIGELSVSSGINQCCDSDPTEEQGGPSWHQTTILNQLDSPIKTSSNAPVVQIWSGSNSPDSSTHPADGELVEVSCLDEIEPHRSASQLSDSGIDSQLASPTVIDGYNKLQEQSFVLDLSATHLSVPSRLRPGSLQSCQDKQHPLKEDEPIYNSVADENTVHGDDPSPASTVPSTASGFLPQKRLIHFLFFDMPAVKSSQQSRLATTIPCLLGLPK